MVIGETAFGMLRCMGWVGDVCENKCTHFGSVFQHPHRGIVARLIRCYIYGVNWIGEVDKIYRLNYV